MSKLRDKLNYLEKDNIKKTWEKIESTSTEEPLSTRAKLEKLVNLSLKRDPIIRSTRNKKEPNPDFSTTANHVIHKAKNNRNLNSPVNERPIHNFHELEDKNAPIIIKDFYYPLSETHGKFPLSLWHGVTTNHLAITFGPENLENIRIKPMNLLFFDTETTGLAGGTGTIAFMLGFGFFNEDSFQVKIFILNDLYREDFFLEEVDRFLQSRDFSATVTFNGKSFDFPLMETRYILQRKRFPLLKLPHLDFLFPARMVWKHTYESRRLGYLGDILLGISRVEDIDGSQIPTIYFNYLRSKSFYLLQKVVEHNAMDLLGLAALLLVVIQYQEDLHHTDDEGEILGIAKLFEKSGDITKANELYDYLKRNGTRPDMVAKAVANLALLKKREKLFLEASQLWELVTQLENSDIQAVRELSVHFEHREKNYTRAIDYVQMGLNMFTLTETQRQDFEKRLKRLKQKNAALDKEEEKMNG